MADVAVLGLIKGHNSLVKYNRLIRRNALLRKYFNTPEYDFIIFHEGDIQQDVKDMVKCEIGNAEFLNIGKKSFWKKDNNIENVGYKNMCSFYTYYLWQYVKGYKYAIRLDDDSYVYSEGLGNILKDMEKKHLNHVYVRKKEDTHKETKETLPEFSSNYAHKNGIEVSERCFNVTNFYSNFYVTRVQFWLRSDVQDYLRHVVKSDGIYEHRWGDSTIHAMALKMFSDSDKIQKSGKLRYKHGSHGWSNFYVGYPGIIAKLYWSFIYLPYLYVCSKTSK